MPGCGGDLREGGRNAFLDLVDHIANQVTHTSSSCSAATFSTFSRRRTSCSFCSSQFVPSSDQNHCHARLTSTVRVLTSQFGKAPFAFTSRSNSGFDGRFARLH